MRLDGVRPPGAVRRLVAALTPGRRLAIAITLASALSAGAARTREAAMRNAAREGADRVTSNLDMSACAREVLSRHGLLRAALVDPGGTALRLEAALASRPGGEPDFTLTLAELWYRAALRQPRHDPASAVPPLRAAAAAAALALADPDVGCCDRAVLVHNHAVARLVRISQDERVFAGRNWTLGLAGLGVVAAGRDPFVDPGRFAEVVVAEDVHVSGIRHRFRTCGLGVPVIGTRCVDRDHPTNTDELFFPTRFRIAATVLAAPGGGLAGGAYRMSPLGLVFHDPFRVGSAWTGGRALSLASDRTAHLALQASQDRLRSQAIRGVIATEFGPEIEPGLYMFRPYAPGKIPVVFVHGLAATPVAFLQAINEFQNDPVLSSRYQFWVFLYPTGRTIVLSAMRFRAALSRAEAAYGADPAFHRMVVVGHSMGGILAHMVVSDSGREVWDAALNVSPEGLRASPETRAELDQLLFFHPVPYVRRVVFIATPHRGSRLANSVVGRFFSGRIQPPPDQAALIDELEALNGPGVIKDENFRRAAVNAIGELRVDSPLLLAVGGLPVAPGVPYHSIAFRFGGHAPNDLVVPLWSARLEGAVTEAILPGFHGSEQSPAALNEVRRILLEHLAGP
ncbi:MAG: lysophospholipase [Isosphaeraceae bacterium]